MRKPKAILFDLWGTVIRSDEFDPARGNAAVFALAENPSGAALQSVQELADRVVTTVSPWEEESRLEFTEQSLLKILADTFDLRFRVSLSELEWAFWAASLRISLTDGIGEVLAELDARRIEKCIVSNSSFMSATLERELGGRGLLPRFRFVVSSADYGIRKPDRVIFDVALARLGVSPQEAWFVGDNIVYDVQGPSAVGMLPIVYDGKQDMPEDVGEFKAISHWRELIELLDSADDANRDVGSGGELLRS